MKSKIDIAIRRDEIYDDNPEDELGELDQAEMNCLDWLHGDGDSITENEMEVPKTPEEVDAVIAQLRKEKEELPARSFFGTDNWGTIERQIETLEWFKERGIGEA